MRGFSLPWQAGVVRERFAAVAFWALAVMLLVNLHYLYLWGLPGVREVGFAFMLACCLAALALSRAWAWKSMGTPFLLIVATIISYLVIGSIASFVNAAASQAEFLIDVARQVFFLLVLLAAALGARGLLKRAGPEALLKGAFIILIASCVIVFASPFLRDLDVLPVYRLPRWTGAFTDPNDAGFIGCMTAALALAFLGNRRHSKLAWLGLALGYVAILGSLSKMAGLVFCILSLFFIALHGRRQLLLLYILPVASLLSTASFWLTEPISAWLNDMQAGSCQEIFADNPGLAKDCDILLAARETLGAKRALNWDESTPMNSWYGVKLGGRPLRVQGLYLMRMGMHGKIPPELGDLDQLVVLRMGRNYLHGSIPPELGKLANLAELGLGNNRLTGTIPRELGNLSKLRELWLKNNQLAGAVPKAVLKLDLSVLRLQRNKLSNAPRNRTRVRLPTLETARLSDAGYMITAMKGDKHRSGLAIRWGLAKGGLDLFLESPFIGNGIYKLHYLSADTINYLGEMEGVHNVYLMLAGEAGLVPLLLYLLFLCSLARLLWVAPKSPTRDVIVFWVAIIACFSMVFQHLLTLGASMFLIGLCCALEPAGRGMRLPHPDS